MSYEIPGKYTTAKVYVDVMEPGLVGQLTAMVNHPAFTNPIVIMPDTHVGKGCVIGFTMKLTDKIIPNVVGVDIGCGMLAAKVGPLPRGMDFLTIDKKIRTAIPFGMTSRKEPVGNLDRFSFSNPQRQASDLASALGATEVPTYDLAWLKSVCSFIGTQLDKVLCSIGTLGGGNHFIELGRETSGDYWIIIHSGSRNFGLKVCEQWQKIAAKHKQAIREEEYQAQLDTLKQTCEKRELDKEVKALKERLLLTPMGRGMEHLEGRDRMQYLYHMVFAQWYASVNRKVMLDEIVKAVGFDRPTVNEMEHHGRDIIETIHNYIDPSDLVIRKGAIRANTGEFMVIPLNMRDGTLLCQGKGNPEWLCSAPHGAGRVLSRSGAKEALTLTQFKEDMAGIVSTSICRATIDESPRAYKDPKFIQEAIAPTAILLDQIRPVLNLKSTS
jgi:RNA-splicing ligase RtcB